MCLDKLWSDEQKNEWLNTQPDEITCYKVVALRGGKANALFFSLTFNKVNDQRHCVADRIDVKKKESYIAHYHLFPTEQSARLWLSDIGWEDADRIMKCTVPKQDVCAIGTQSGQTVIVTKYFEFAEGDQYFREAQPCA
jgi:hypothetical protein